MNFKQTGHYPEVLEKELPFLREFANLTLGGLRNSSLDFAIEDVEDLTTVNLDYYHRPCVKGSMDKLKNLVDKLMKKWGEYFDEDEGMSRVLRHLKNSLAEGSICGEVIYFPLFNERNPYENPQLRKDVERLKKAILHATPGGVVFGFYAHRYNDKDYRTITLFPRNFANHNDEDYISAFAHEYFHAIHRTLMDKYKTREKLNRYYHDVVLESLATYFQSKYLEYRGYSAKASEIERNVSKYSPIFYPYSGCRYLLKDYSRFEEVIIETLFYLPRNFYGSGFTSALKKLIPDRYELEIILMIDRKEETHYSRRLKSNSRRRKNTSSARDRHGNKLPPYPLSPEDSGLYDRIGSPLEVPSCDNGEITDIHFYKVKARLSEIENESCCRAYDINDKVFLGVRKGDIIFHEVSGDSFHDGDSQIKAFSIATNDPLVSVAGASFGNKFFHLKNYCESIVPQTEYIKRLTLFETELFLERIIEENRRDSSVAELLLKVVRAQK